MITNNECSPSSTESCRSDSFVERRVQQSGASFCRRILVVDDELCIRELTQRILESAGYFVKCAEDGEVGRELLRGECFDVLVTDHCMPRLSGMELLRWLRKEHKAMPVLFISGNMPWEEPDFRACLSPGETLQKPFSCSALLAAVKAVWALASVGEDGRVEPPGVPAPLQLFPQALGG